MTVTFTALLCLGLTLGHGTPVLAGTFPKPVLRVQPDSVISVQTTVTFLCEGTLKAQEYHLYKNGHQYTNHTDITSNPKNKVEFSISKIGHQEAGNYTCRYRTLEGWSEYSDTLQLVVTGTFNKPSLSALPSPVVTEGGNVTLQCVSNQGYYGFILTKEGPQKQSWTLHSKYNYSISQYHACISVGPVTSNQRWTFRCYSFESYSRLLWSKPSDPLELLFSGTVNKPTIKAEPGPVVALGSPMNISCQGTLNAELYFLHKEGSKKPWGTQTPKEPGSKSIFSIPSVSEDTGGQYRCYCYSSAGWSEPSDTLELVVTGIYDNKPGLTALPSPVVTSGGNMTLQCVSQESYNKFILTKEDQKFSSSLNSQYLHSINQYQALFSIDHVTADHTGTFRCYGYYNQTPQLWSAPSEPLEMHISGPIGSSSPPPSSPLPTAGLEMYLKALIGVSVAFLLLLSILIFLLLRRRRQGKFRKDAQKETKLQLPAGAPEPVTRDRGLQKRSNPAAATQEEILYASVKDMKPEDGVNLDSLAAESEEPQDVVYAQLWSRSPRQGTAAPPYSQAAEAPEEPSVYAALTVTRPGPVPNKEEQ